MLPHYLPCILCEEFSFDVKAYVDAYRPVILVGNHHVKQAVFVNVSQEFFVFIGNYEDSRAFVFLKLTYENFPPHYHLWTLAILIYLNFFTHHFFYDIRYLLFIYALVVFWKTKIQPRPS